MRPRPHDLLRLDDWHAAIRADTPPWVAESLAATPWVVVRRSVARPGGIPVGVRGPSRSHRHAMALPSYCVAETITPQMLSSDLPESRFLPPFDAVRAVALRLRGTELRWGPTGSVGFELATGSPCVSPDSDLDLAVYLDSAADTAGLHALQSVMEHIPCRIDCQLEFSWGAVALADLASGSPTVLAKCPDGPRLVETAALTS